MNIVIADNSSTVLKLLREQLTLLGHNVDVFQDGAEARDHIYRHADVEILITSLELRGVSGFELIWSVRANAERPYPVYIIAMSSNGDEKSLEQVLDSGADDFFSKSPNRIEFSARVRSAARTIALQRKLIFGANHDAMTSLLNRRAFLSKANALVLQEDQFPLAVVMFDVDHFKSINDRCGHAVGDLVLLSIADCMKREDRAAGRLGGEEFAFLLPDTDADSAFRMADRFRQRVAETAITADSLQIRCTCSFGVSCVDVGEKTIDEALKRADQALYQSKRSGRNLVSVCGSAFAAA
ncbi:MAG: diguanylate cyclase [Pseudomonadota bacterium]